MATKNKKNKSLPKKYRLYYYGFWIIFVFGLLGGFGLFYSASTILENSFSFIEKDVNLMNPFFPSLEY